MTRDKNGNTYKVWRDAVEYIDHEKYTLLCWNYNCATKEGKVCPHKRKEKR